MAFALPPGSPSVLMGFRSVAFLRFFAPFALLVLRFTLAICFALLMAALRSPFIVSGQPLLGGVSRGESVGKETNVNSSLPRGRCRCDQGQLLDVERATRKESASLSRMGEVDWQRVGEVGGMAGWAGQAGEG